MFKITQLPKVILPTLAVISITFATPFSDKILNEIDKLIYGLDNRQDIYEVTNPALIALADSTVALIKNADLTNETDGSYSVSSSSFSDSYNLCESEKFGEQINPAFCSGFLVGDDTMVTAGHCITSQSDCDATSFVFGFNVPSAGQTNTTFSSDDVYKCEKILGRDEVSTGADWAIIKLDRSVEGRFPLKVRTSGEASVGDQLVVIGHPVGLPVKVSGGASVRTVNSNGYLVANLDTYGGNSGSAVFNLVTKEVEGILVRGDTDFVYEGSCRVSNVCTDEGCRGEDVTLISQVCGLNGTECSETSGGSDGSTTTPTPTGPNSCQYAFDNTCDDGRPGSSYSICEYGTDEADCSNVDPTTGGDVISDILANSCQYANDGSCDDGRPGASYNLCEHGTDENDCSPANMANSCRYANDGSCDDGRPGASYSLCPSGTDENDCSPANMANSCRYANDNSCDDGRPGSSYGLCTFGTDENDCRNI